MRKFSVKTTHGYLLCQQCAGVWNRGVIAVARLAREAMDGRGRPDDRSLQSAQRHHFGIEYPDKRDFIVMHSFLILLHIQRSAVH